MSCAYLRKRGRCGLPESDLIHAVLGTVAYDDLSDEQRAALTMDFDCHPFTPESNEARIVARITTLLEAHAECATPDADRNANRGCYRLLTYCNFYDAVKAAIGAGA